MHGHPWNLWSFLLRGSYTHLYEGESKRCNALSFISAKFPKEHAIHDVAEGSISLVIHGFKKSASSENFYNNEPDSKYGIIEDDVPHSGVAILKWTPELQAKINKRKKSIARLRKLK
jgi:hypothetical protein